MIKFFRRIRQQLLSENKTGKYFKYAIGEILLVMIGILLALQVNNWNEHRKTEEVEAQLLSQLIKDLELNNKDVGLNIHLLQRSINSTNILLKQLESKLPYHDSLNTHLANTIIWTRLVVNAGAYQTIQSKGVDIISNVNLRNEILELYEGKLYWIQQLENGSMNYIENLRVNEFRDYFKFNNPFIVSKSNKVVSGTAEIISYEKMNQSTSFKYHLENIKSYNMVLELTNKNYFDDTTYAIEIIEDEIRLKQ